MQVKKIKFLSKRKVKEIEELLEKSYGARLKFREIVWVETRNNKIWILSQKIGKLDLAKLKISSAGLYFGRLLPEKRIRLSIEGSQLVGCYAKKNFVILNENEAKRFASGYDVKVKKAINCEEGNFVLVKYKDDFLGCGKFSKGFVENVIPKSRRIELA